MPKDETNQGSVMGSQMGQQQSHEVVLQSMEFVGLPNIGNTCYINSMLHSLYFCRSFVHPFYRALPQDKSLIMMQKVYGELRKRDRTNLKTMMAELKAQLPEDFSGNFSQQDVMELGRFLIDKFT
jgi:ubiquitin C-terminal hydrolase